MTKYIFEPITEVVLATFKENSNGIDRSEEFPNGLTARLTVTANSEEECLAIRGMVTHHPSWQLVGTEE
jgi:hypothetical protein